MNAFLLATCILLVLLNLGGFARALATGRAGSPAAPVFRSEEPRRFRRTLLLGLLPVPIYGWLGWSVATMSSRPPEPTHVLAFFCLAAFALALVRGAFTRLTSR